MNNYKFIEALDDATYEYLLKKYGYSETSDISPIEGWALLDNVIEVLLKENNDLKFKVYDIPEKYQENIGDFYTDYWDGNVILE